MKKREERDEKCEGKDSIECAVVSLGVGVACLLVQFERKLCLRRRVIETFKRQFPSLSTDTLNGRQRHGKKTKTTRGRRRTRRKKLRSEIRKRNGKLNGARAGNRKRHTLQRQSSVTGGQMDWLGHISISI